MSETAYELGAALGIAILGTVLGAYYRAIVVVPAGLPTDASAAVDDSLSSTVGAIAEQPQDIADQMLLTARTAFTDAFSVTSIVAAVICFAGAIVAFRVLPTKAEERQVLIDH